MYVICDVPKLGKPPYSEQRLIKINASAQPNIEFNPQIDEEMCLIKSYFYFRNISA